MLSSHIICISGKISKEVLINLAYTGLIENTISICFLYGNKCHPIIPIKAVKSGFQTRAGIESKRIYQNAYSFQTIPLVLFFQ